MIVGYCNVFISCCKRVKYYSSSELDTIVSAATVLWIFSRLNFCETYFIYVSIRISRERSMLLKLASVSSSMMLFERRYGAFSPLSAPNQMN